MSGIARMQKSDAARVPRTDRCAVLAAVIRVGETVGHRFGARNSVRSDERHGGIYCGEAAKSTTCESSTTSGEAKSRGYSPTGVCEMRGLPRRGGERGTQRGMARLIYEDELCL